MEKYILILAQDGDVSADNVIDWICSYDEYKIVRITTQDALQFINISITNFETRFSIAVNNGIEINSKDIYSYWYRRGELRYTPVDYSDRLFNAIDAGANINGYYLKEFEHTIDTLHYLLKHLPIITINSFDDIFTNKLINLEVARDCGLNIPDTIVSNQINVIKDFVLKHRRCITKPIRYPGHFLRHMDWVVHYSQHTNLIDEDIISRISEQYAAFQPTLFQKYMDKEFEVRSFFLEKRFYSMAIFSQQNEKTKVDFRNYDDETPNRNVPYSLPALIEKQLYRFSRAIGINAGSFDLIFKEGKYYFLEINPVGQFQWLSHNCYYQIEHEIAKHLMGKAS